MIETILTKKCVSRQMKLTVKTLLSAGLVVLAVLLPQLVHIAAGPQGGAAWLPMYLPVLLGGCLLGTRWGLCVGLLSPVASFLFTSAALGQAMPAAGRLPFMMAELAILAFIAGLFSDKITNTPWLAFPAAVLGFLGCRLVFLLLVLLFGSLSSLSLSAVWQQIRMGFGGMAVQMILAPMTVLVLRRLLDKE